MKIYDEWQFKTLFHDKAMKPRKDAKTKQQQHTKNIYHLKGVWAKAKNILIDFKF